MTFARRFLLAAAAVGVAGLLAAWWWRTPTRERALDPAWEAVVTTAAGSGEAGPADGRRYEARFADPFGVAVLPDGTICVADGAGAHRIRRLAPDGTVSTLAGGEEGFADGAGASARFDTPSGLAVAPDGSLIVADTGNDAVRRVTAAGVVSTLAAPGSGLRGPLGVAVQADGTVLVADTYNDRIVSIAPDGSLRVVAGTGEPGFVDGLAADARFDTPAGVAVDASGTIYVADTGNGAVRALSRDGEVRTIAPGFGDGPLRPVGIAVAPGGSVFVTDDRGRVVEITSSAGQRVVAGGRSGYRDGAGSEARFRALSGIAVAAEGHVIVADRRNRLVREVIARTRSAFGPPPPPLRPQFAVEAFGNRPLLWPFAPMEGPFEITGTLGEPRGGEGSERLHAGLDVHAAEGTPVRAVRGGVVEDPVAAWDFGTLNESLRVGPVAYVHLRVGRDAQDRPLGDTRFVATTDARGRAVRIRVKRGARFATGEVIGTVNRFYHAHLNIGWPGEEVNPLAFRLHAFEDTVPPTIARGGVQVLGEDGVPFTRRERRRVVVHGRVRILVDAWDQVNGNLARRRLGVYRLGYQWLTASGQPVEGFEVPRETIRFDRHPRDPEAARIVYASGSGIPVYGNRSTRFLYRVTSTLRDGVAADGTFDTAALSPGDYTLRILVADIRGNEALANRDLPITVLSRPVE
ncbi:MAG TPA: hypothetical protein VM364_15845 [Vicinamibacterales bacterium]|nr:hypothetical protein [Vicinamibacterales bacterium]